MPKAFNNSPEGGRFPDSVALTLDRSTPNFLAQASWLPKGLISRRSMSRKSCTSRSNGSRAFISRACWPMRV